MLIMELDRAPLLAREALIRDPFTGATMDGMITEYTEQGPRDKPGEILELWRQLRVHTGVVLAKKKEGVRFKVRSAEDLIDKIREKANELGILIYPVQADGKGHVVEDGTLAEVNLGVVAQAVSDGSRLLFAGFGLGADSQDKAGGKAGTYAFKQALLQALLAGGAKEAKALGIADTDDSDTPITGGVRKKTSGPSMDTVRQAAEAASTYEEYRAAVKLAMQLPAEKQLAVKDALKDAAKRNPKPEAS